eukprot:2394606-Ditylum_brightwellii.AAC.1
MEAQREANKTHPSIEVDSPNKKVKEDTCKLNDYITAEAQFFDESVYTAGYLSHLSAPTNSTRPMKTNIDHGWA